MIHLGDITKINGGAIPPVDVIIGGSPCQDLSIAGNRKGLQGERSGLFMEQIRIIKEMRNTYGADYPRFMVWENVPGAFSSNNGEDFRAVLEETVGIIQPGTVIPRPEKWKTSGYILGDGWSVAWRILDAQFWGVPQRRRRISLIADFGGNAAPEILFIRKSLSGDYPPGREERKRTTVDAERGINTPIWDIGDRRRVLESLDVSPSLLSKMGTGGNNVPIIPDKAYCLQGNGIDRADTAGCNGKGWTEDVSYTLNTIDRPAVLPFNTTQITSPQNGNNPKYGDPCHTLASTDHPPAIVMAHGQANAEIIEDMCPTLNCNHEQPILAAFPDPANTLLAKANMSFRGDQDTLIAEVDCRNGVENPDVNGTLQAKSSGGTSYNLQNTVRINQLVRRLTPLECERLQGYPDDWTDIGEWTDSKGKKRQTTDGARYKALGNSIALPPWKWILKRICSLYERDSTMGSLFDGIGGFPLIWEQLNGKGSCLWASEIEEFCIAVTEKRFGS